MSLSADNSRAKNEISRDSLDEERRSTCLKNKYFYLVIDALPKMPRAVHKKEP